MTTRIRLARDEDAAAIAAIYRPVVEGTAISFEATPPDSAEMLRRLRDTLPTHPWLVCELDGVVAGYAYGSRYRVRAAYQWSVETSVYIDDRFRRRGVGRGLYESLNAILVAQGFVNAYAGITLPNETSVAFHESVGFEPIGVYRGVGYKFGKWWNVGWWYLTLVERPQAPAPPRDMAALAADARWVELLSRGEARIRAAGE